MLRPISTELQRLMFLRYVVIPFVREREKEGRVNFRHFDCGTTKCLLGWCASEFPNETGITRDLFCHTDRTMVQLTGKPDGGYDVFWYQLFGQSERVTLNDRAKVVDRLIEKMIAEAVES